MRCALILGAFFCGWGLVGCGGTSAPTTENAGQAGGNAAAQTPGAAQPVSVPADAPPDQVIAAFLDALRGGDKATTASLLTGKALAETSKHNLSVCPQATPHMQYKVNKSQVLPENPNGAHVSVTWTENYPDGTVTYDVIWVLRRHQEGWRVAGMAIELVPGQGLTFLNFEDPDDMMRKQEEAMAALQPAAVETAAVPGGAPANTSASPTDFPPMSGQAPSAIDPGNAVER